MRRSRPSRTRPAVASRMAVHSGVASSLASGCPRCRGCRAPGDRAAAATAERAGGGCWSRGSPPAAARCHSSGPRPTSASRAIVPLADGDQRDALRRTVGRSLSECTARSIRPASMASSICRVKSAADADPRQRHVLARCRPWSGSRPARSGARLRSVARGSRSVCHSASALPRVPTRSVAARHCPPVRSPVRPGAAIRRGGLAARDDLAERDAFTVRAGQRQPGIPALDLVHDVLESAVAQVVLRNGLGPEMEGAEGGLALDAQQQRGGRPAPARSACWRSALARSGFRTPPHERGEQHVPVAGARPGKTWTRTPRPARCRRSTSGTRKPKPSSGCADVLAPEAEGEHARPADR